ncbi:MAG: Trk family potassium uptake protein [Christensenellaceae bacterium]|nr:Trk family potassium uptake protein [Christensenellaceae bacterium]
MLLGGLVLSLPISWADGYRVSLLDAMFSSFSAVCVTGLSTIEIGQCLSIFGQMVMLVLIQVGGLGFMTMTALLFMAVGRRISLADRVVLQESLNGDRLQGVVKTTRTAVFLTLGCEGAGAALFAVRMIPLYGFGKGLYYSVWHAVSAFCNAGFDVIGSGTNFGVFAGEPYILVVTMLLIVVGGLGFLVVMELAGWAKARGKKRLSLQAKVVVISSLALIGAGALCYGLLEWNNPATLGAPGLSPGDKVVGALFQSVTTRTAGFSTFGQGGLRTASAALTLVLMLIGASQAGTGGGLKTTTCAIVLAMLRSAVRGQDETILFKRRISRANVLKAVTLVILGVLFVAVTTLLLTITESSIGAGSLLFEVISAFGTVGLSQNVTPLLNPAGKIIIICCMYAGRVGLMTVMTALTMRIAKNKANIRFAEERIMVG